MERPVTHPRFDDLGTHVAESLESVRSERGATARVRARIAAGAARLPTRHRGPVVSTRMVLSLVAAAIAVAATMVLWPRSNLSFRVAESQAVPETGRVGAFLQAPEQTEMPLTFSDGTVLRLAPRAQARVAAVSARGANVLLESGAIQADVVHRTDTRWSVEAGPFAIHVTGTKFVAEWDPASESVVVTLEEGSVIVTGCVLGQKGQRVVAGERLTSSCKTAKAAIARAPAVRAGASAITPDLVLTPAPSAPPTPPAIAATALPDAKEDATRKPTPESVLRAPEAASAVDTDLLHAADVERFAGRLDRAKTLLKQARSRAPGSSVAANAAFELGRVTFEQRRFAEAAEWFELYLREDPSGELTREALGRATESWVRAGDHVRARPLATRYLAYYPEGPHSTFARRLLAGGSP